MTVGVGMGGVTITGQAQETYIVGAVRVAVTCFMLNLKRICDLLRHPVDEAIIRAMQGQGVHYYIDMSAETLEKSGGSVSRGRATTTTTTTSRYGGGMRISR